MIVVDSIPDPIVVPRGGSIDVTVVAHSEPGDDPGSFQLVFVPDTGPTQILATVVGVLDDPNDPVPWDQINFVTFGVDDISITNNGDGVYTFTHTES